MKSADTSARRSARVSWVLFTPVVVRLVARELVRRWPTTSFTVSRLRPRSGTRLSAVLVRWSDGPSEEAVNSWLACDGTERRVGRAGGGVRPGAWMPPLLGACAVTTQRTITPSGMELIAAALERDCGVSVPRTDEGIDWERAADVSVMAPIQLSGSAFESLAGTAATTMQGPVPVALALRLVSEFVDLTGGAPQQGAR